MATGETRVALLGFGTVGRSVTRILTEHPPPGDVRWTDNIYEVFDSDATVIVEVIGGRNPASAWVRRALESGRSVVTANKQLIAHEGAALTRLAATARR